MRTIRLHLAAVAPAYWSQNSQPSHLCNGFLAMNRLNPTIPFNWRTAIFCFLMGIVLSVPVSLLPQEAFFELSERGLHAYYVSVGVSFILLPFWSDSAVRDYPPLPKLGKLTFIFLLIPGLAILLFPPIA